MNPLKSYRALFNQAPEVESEQIRVGGIWAVYKLFNRYYLKSFFGPFFALVFPVLIYGIIGSITNHIMMFPGVCMMVAMSTGMTGMPFTILELKKSVLLKRIGASPVKTTTFTIVVITYFTAAIFLSILWLMIWALAFFQDPNMFNTLGTVVGFFGFLYGNILNIIVSLSFGFAISALAKTENSAQAIGMLIYFPSSFLSGGFFSVDLIASSTVLEWISRFIPARYTNLVITESWGGWPTGLVDFVTQINPNYDLNPNPFLIHDYYIPNPVISIDTISYLGAPTIEAKAQIIASSFQDHEWANQVYDKADHILAYVVPYALIAGLGWFSVRKFSWSAGR